MTFLPPESFNMADYFLDDRVREGLGDKVAIRSDQGDLTYKEVQSLANRFAQVLQAHGGEPEDRILIALPDIPEYIGALFGILKLGSVVVMVNSHLKANDISYFYNYTRAKIAIVHHDSFDEFAAAAKDAPYLKKLLVVGGAKGGHPSFENSAKLLSENFPNAQTHRDDAAIWLFSGGTTGKPKAVVQTHTSFANTTELYGKGAIGYQESDITLSIPKLYFGYATGSNLLFPFSVGATVCLFTDRCSSETLFEKIAKYKPTILINVPTMINHMVSHPTAPEQDLGSIRLSTSAGEALPEELYHRWKNTFGVELLDGLGTAEMWHIFITNTLAATKPGSIGKVVEGFDVRVCDDDGNDIPPNEVGALHVRGNSMAIGYWQNMEKTKAHFLGDWYRTGDMVSRDEEGWFTYCGRGDELLKVSGKWLAPGEVENCLLQHPSVKECAVVGKEDENGLIKPRAYVVVTEKTEGLESALQQFVKETIEPYKYPREVLLLDTLPRTHLGKVDRADLRKRP